MNNSNDSINMTKTRLETEMNKASSFGDKALNEAKKFGQQVEQHASDAYQTGEEKAANLYEQGRNQVNQMASSVKTAAHEFAEQGREKLNAAQSYMEDCPDKLITLVKSNPLASLLVASGLGFLLSLLSSKK